MTATALPTAPELYDAIDATWPAASQSQQGAWTIREGQGGGSRVSSATANWPVTDADLPVAEAAMRHLGQTPQFMIREGDDALDALLDAHGYEVVDPVNLWVAETATLISDAPPPGTLFAMWPPLAIMREIWAEGGIGPERIAVMDRATGNKVGIVTRDGDYPAGVGFAAISGDIAMIHALHVKPAHRRKGIARRILHAAAQWADENGARYFALAVTRENHAANPLYASLGMHLIGHYHYRRLSKGGDGND